MGLILIVNFKKGASRARASAALKQYRDVDQAAECIFDGKFDHIEDNEGDIEMERTPAHGLKVKYVPCTDDFLRIKYADAY